MDSKIALTEFDQKLYKDAVIAAQNIDVEYLEAYNFDAKCIILVGVSLCPCGILEQIFVNCLNDKTDYRFRIKLHHSWHIACFNAGIDTETPCDSKLLEKIGNDYLQGKWN
jgi:hypothetical protein